MLDVGLEELTPDTKGNKEGLSVSVSMAQRVMKDLETMRNHGTYKKDFERYVAANKNIDSDFVDENFTVFKKAEIDTIVSMRQMDEAFLEKYFDLIDSEIISHHQSFSEGFFMRHFGELNTNAVLKSGKNEWCKKENRSKRLDVFLRLKGVKI